MTQDSTNLLDVLSRDLTAVDLEPPLFKDGQNVVFEVKGITASDNKKGNPQLVVDLVTVNPEPHSKGGQFPAGKKYTHRIQLGLTSKDGKDISSLVDRRLKEFRLGATGNGNGAFGDPNQYVGCRLTAVMSIRPPSEGFGKQNDIARFIKPGTPTRSSSSEL
jgi:hypothetical protein